MLQMDDVELCQIWVHTWIVTQGTSCDKPASWSWCYQEADAVRDADKFEEGVELLTLTSLLMPGPRLLQWHRRMILCMVNAMIGLWLMLLQASPVFHAAAVAMRHTHGSQCSNGQWCGCCLKIRTRRSICHGSPWRGSLSIAQHL